jgi:competence protein ComEC
VSKRPVCLCAISFLVIIFFLSEVFSLFADRVPDETALCREGDYVTLSGEIQSIQEQYGQYYIQIQDERSVNVLAVAASADGLEIGTDVYASGVVSFFDEARNPGMFDARAYYRTFGICFRLKKAVVSPMGSTKQTVTVFLSRLRRKIRDGYAACLPSEEAGILGAMTLSDKTYLESDTKKLYSGSGIAHLLVISGLHISILGMGLYRLLRKCALPVSVSTVTSLLLVFLYGIMTGMKTATVRAIVMYAVLLSADLCRRSYDAWTALAIAAVLLVASNPALLTYSGFLLSFTAVGGALSGSAIGKLYQHRRYGKIRQSLIVSLTVELLTAPVLMWNYYEIPIYAPLLNLLILPWMSVLVVCALLGGGLSIFSLTLARILLWICHFLLQAVAHLAAWTQTLPFSVIITGRPSVVDVILYYVTAFLLLYLLLFVRRDVSRLPFLCYERCIRLARLCLFLLIIILIFPASHSYASFALLDVGQGDGIFFQTQSGICMCIDGGSSSVSNVGEQRILTFLKYNRVHRIDYWFVSHTDEDHISGLVEVLEDGYPVGSLVLAKGMEEEASELVSLAQEKGTQILWMEAGDQMQIGADQIECLSPSVSDTSENVEDINEQSLVLKITLEGVSFLCTGDIGKETEERLLSKGANVDADILKVAHHGSKNSSEEAFVAAVSPKLAIISAGKNNRYGHPASETLDTLDKMGIPYYCTIDTGALLFQIKKGEVVCRRYVNFQ